MLLVCDRVKMVSPDQVGLQWHCGVMRGVTDDAVERCVEVTIPSCSCVIHVELSIACNCTHWWEHQCGYLLTIALQGCEAHAWYHLVSTNVR